jgi:hypothetical protein
VGGVLLRSAHVCGIEELCILKLSTSKGEIVENKHPLSSPAGERENIMGTMDINPLLIKLSVPMMVSMLPQLALSGWGRFRVLPG